MDDGATLVIFIIGVAFVAYCRVMLTRVRRSQHWHPTTGTIERSEVVKTRSRGSPSSTIYKAAIEYTYGVGGREFRSDKICIGGTLDTSMRKRAEARCAKYPQGVAVPVYYDPSSPGNACLERTAEGARLFTWLGVGMIALAALTYLGVIRFH